MRDHKNTMHEYPAKIRRVIDGDTVDMTIDLGFRVSVNVRARLFGLDAPEITGPTAHKGKAAAAWLSERLATRPAWTIKTYKQDSADKYGRYLVLITDQPAADEFDRTINAEMIAAGYATPYLASPSTTP